MIIGWTVAVSAAGQVGRDEKFELLAWGVTESRFGKDRPEVVLTIDLPINPANWNGPFLFEGIDIHPEDQMDLLLYFEPGNSPNWNIKGIRGDVVSSVINARFEFQNREKLVAGPIRKRKFSRDAGDGIRIDAIRAGEIISFRVNSELKVVFVE